MADGPKRPSRPGTKSSVAKLIEKLPFLETVDTMLLENTPAADVAKYILDEQGALPGTNPKTLTNALLARRKQKLETEGFGFVHAVRNEDMVNYREELGLDPSPRRAPHAPRTLVRALYSRTKGGIKELLELEILYLAQRDRIDRIMEMESAVGAFHDRGGMEIAIAADILMKRVQAKNKFGLGEGDEFELRLNVRSYSKNTAEVLSRPESRHRVMSLLERMTRLGQLKGMTDVQIALPPPTQTED